MMPWEKLILPQGRTLHAEPLPFLGLIWVRRSMWRPAMHFVRLRFCERIGIWSSRIVGDQTEAAMTHTVYRDENNEWI